MFVVAFFRRLQGHTKLALSGGPFALGSETKPARVSTLCPHRGIRFCEFNGAVQILKRRFVVSLTAGNSRQRMQRFRFSLIVAGHAQSCRRAPEKTLSRFEFATQARHFSAMRQGAWMCL